MHRMRTGMGGLCLVLLGLLGCSSTEPNLKPPLHEEYTLPPTDDPRFSQPIAYPKETLNNFKRDRDAGPAGGPGSLRGPGTMGAGGGY